jgi:hypothetical protein
MPSSILKVPPNFSSFSGMLDGALSLIANVRSQFITACFASLKKPEFFCFVVVSCEGARKRTLFAVVTIRASNESAPTPVLAL